MEIQNFEKLVKCAEDNPDLSLCFIEEILIGLEELKQEQVIPYEFK